MKYLITYLALSLLTNQLSAQQKIPGDTSLKFDLRYTQCERKWVILSKADTSKVYSYGYIYIDSLAGFTYNLQGQFKVGPGNAYVPDTIPSIQGSVKSRISMRIPPNWRRGISLVPTDHMTELDIKGDPEWVKFYYSIKDTVAHDYRWGFIYNDLGESGIALNYLEPAYKMQQHAKGVEFELGFAYNVLGRYDDAIRVLEPAIQHDPENALFYKELAYAHLKKKEYKEAIETYKLALQHYPDKVDESRGELAFNMAQAYKTMGDQESYKSWMIKAKSFTPTNSRYYKAITDAGF